MLDSATIDGLKALRLDAMAAALAEQREQASYTGLGFDERLGLLVDRELTARASRRMDRCLKAARLRSPAAVEDIDFRHPRGLDRAQILSLAQAHWASNRRAIVITGPTGSGKHTWPAPWPTPPSETGTPRSTSAPPGCSTSWPSPAATGGWPGCWPPGPVSRSWSSTTC
jgi:hypothetical protein